MSAETLEGRESARLKLQAELDSQKSQQERNVLGQFATPPRLAREVVEAALEISPSGAPIRFLDPGVGTGAFYSALEELVPGTEIQAAIGFEIDPHYALPSEQLWKGTRLEVRCQDFTAAVAPASELDRFNLIVCNPPYVRHHHIRNGRKKELQEAFAEKAGVTPSGLMGLHCHFLVLAHDWLVKGGVAAWLIPSEFMDVRYGLALKSYLLSKVTLVRIHRFLPDDLQFADALVSSAVVFFKKGHEPAEIVEFTAGGTLAHPSKRLLVPPQALRREGKWTRFPEHSFRGEKTRLALGDLFTIKRGIATGDNRFFILSEAQLQTKQLPREFFKPILPSPRYLRDGEVKSLADGSPALDRRLFVLNCDLPEEELKARHPALWAYLQDGIQEVSGGFLCRHRRPWYSQEKREPAPLLCTYMGRKGGNTRPFRFILNHSNAIAPNVYLMLFPKPALRAALSAESSLLTRIWQYLNNLDVQSLIAEGRVYGGGLYKMEPRELAELPVEQIAKMLPRRPMSASDQQELFASFPCL